MDPKQDGLDYRAQFLADVAKRKIIKVDLPNGGAVWLKEPEAVQAAEFFTRYEGIQASGKKDLTAADAVTLTGELLTQMACDPDGKLILSLEDAEALAKASMEVYRALSRAATALIGEAQNKLPKESENTDK